MSPVETDTVLLNEIQLMDKRGVCRARYYDAPPPKTHATVLLVVLMVFMTFLGGLVVWVTGGP